MLCGQVEVEPSVTFTLGPVPKLLKILAPVANAAHPSKVWLKAPMCPACQAGFRQQTLLNWGLLAITLVSLVLGVAGLASGAPLLNFAPFLALGLLVPLLYLAWTAGPGKAHHIHCSAVDTAHVTVRVCNYEFPRAYTAMKRGERVQKAMAGPAPLPTIVEQPEVVEKEPDPTCRFLRGEELARMPAELSPSWPPSKTGSSRRSPSC